jgi:hypothetical protein
MLFGNMQFSVSQLLKMGSLNSANAVSIFFGNFTVWSAARLSPDGHGRGAHAQPCASRGFSYVLLQLGPLPSFSSSGVLSEQSRVPNHRLALPFVLS